MLTELRVRALGVIDDLHLTLGPGMTAITGETGAGKTLVVEAIELLVGGRSDPARVRAGADEASIEGRFETPDGELVLARAIPAQGRSRAYVDGRMAPVAQLADAGHALVDLHGQHTHQSLLAAGVQRAALDRFGQIDLSARADARADLARIDAELARLGGDTRSRARELDLLRYQVEELSAAHIESADEDDLLAAEEERLADVGAHRAAAAAAWTALGDEGGAADVVATALAEVAARRPFAAHAERLRGIVADLTDVAAELRALGDELQDDPERLVAVQSRRQLLTALRRKYGESLADVIAFAAEATARLEDLEGYEGRAAALEDERLAAAARLAEAEAELGRARRHHAPGLADAVMTQLPELALAGASFSIDTGADATADDVTFLLSANPGEPERPLAKVASGGELARSMLALRLVLRDTTVPTLIFDEVDAGVGGQAAVAVGRALADLAGDHQVLVVTHLPQVAAFADHHVAIVKGASGARTAATAETLDDAGRVGELTRMLSGLPESATGRDHAAELLTAARRERAR
ncbi:MAG TPA: DNA repair protein RecN [Acidimicrobiales bacterium]|nr:DNA repair protein RecN [Acidimicrobiales bacterium]